MARTRSSLCYQHGLVSLTVVLAAPLPLKEVPCQAELLGLHQGFDENTSWGPTWPKHVHILLLTEQRLTHKYSIRKLNIQVK
jgi:hypothetical protein